MLRDNKKARSGSLDANRHASTVTGLPAEPLLTAFDAAAVNDPNNKTAIITFVCSNENVRSITAELTGLKIAIIEIFALPGIPSLPHIFAIHCSVSATEQLRRLKDPVTFIILPSPVSEFGDQLDSMAVSFNPFVCKMFNLTALPNPLPNGIFHHIFLRTDNGTTILTLFFQSLRSMNTALSSPFGHTMQIDEDAVNRHPRLFCCQSSRPTDIKLLMDCVPNLKNTSVFIAHPRSAGDEVKGTTIIVDGSTAGAFKQALSGSSNNDFLGVNNAVPIKKIPEKVIARPSGNLRNIKMIHSKFPPKTFFYTSDPERRAAMKRAELLKEDDFF